MWQNRERRHTHKHTRTQDGQAPGTHDGQTATNGSAISEFWPLKTTTESVAVAVGREISVRLSLRRTLFDERNRMSYLPDTWCRSMTIMAAVVLHLESCSKLRHQQPKQPAQFCRTTHHVSNTLPCPRN